jgi:putative Mg2+ transporter-C (MgtC) family protein
VFEGIDLGLEIELLLRLIVALVLGALIGWERELQQMPAGFRTHALVSLGSAVFTVISGHAFTGGAADPTRIAAQIVSGIGFLGGGAILRHGGSVRGLTTAASLWAVAAIGMAAGAGLFVLAVGGALLVIVTLELFQRLERFIKRRFDLPGSTPPPTDEPELREGD